MAEMWPKKVASVQNAGVLIAGSSAENAGTTVVLLGGRFYTGRQVYEFTDFGGSVDQSESGQPHLAAFREFAEEYFGLSEAGCVPHGRKGCRQCHKTAQSLAQQLWDAAKDSIVGAAPVVHTGQYACFVVPAEAVVPVLQRCGRLPCAPAGASAIDILFSSAKQNPELTSLALVSINELLSAGVCDGTVEPIALRSLDGVQRLGEKITLRKCMVGRGGMSLRALSSRLEEFQQSQKSTPKVPCTSIPKVPCGRSSRLAIVFDMETEDPDDVLTLLFLAAHAAVDLKAVTVTPGSHFQVSLIRWLLKEVGLSGVRVGAQDWPKNKNVSAPQGRFYNNFQHLPTKDSDCEKASQVLLECCDENTTLLTGGPLTNLAAALSHDGFKLGRWVAQGGFAGEGVVPRDRQMNKFKGMTYCRTTNFGSDPRAAHRALRSNSIHRRVCISKNVCHQTLYANGAGGWHTAVLNALHAAQGRPIRRRALQLMHKAMSDYLLRQSGKMIHDPLALAVALDESVCTLAEVELNSYGPKDEQWGCWPCSGSGTWISVDYDEAKFRTTLLHDGFAPQPNSLTSGSLSGSLAKKDEKEEGSLAKKYKKEEANVEGLSSIERNILRLAKKIRAITELEQRRAGGDILQSNQQEKINAKEEVKAQFIHLLESLPTASEVMARVHDLIPSAERLTDNQVATAEEEPEKGNAGGEVEVAAAVHSEVPDATPEGRNAELQKDPVDVKVGEQLCKTRRRERPRGGRSGFKRRFDAKHSA
mmetsp:Transcript_10290/g.18961  ORF Transcript_10290/g.18961 Transcript_10290/m.18961 type:complete len:758 (-) Transcript_10290:152-2425(-)